MQKLLNKVLTRIKPDKKEREFVLKRVNYIVGQINKNLKDAKAELGGSGAKDTWLKGEYDLDIYIKFDYNKFKDKNSILSDISEKVLKKSLKKIKRVHGSRDYFQYREGNFIFEVIPILDIKKKEHALNITDMSPLHVKWVKKKKGSDEIRLTKAFCKAQEVYGAESYIMGFSGYICEILTVNYKSFIGLIKNASKWKDKEFIDISGHHKNKNDILMNVNKSKLISPIVVIDPVQKDRNAAAALGNEKYRKFIKSCKEFLKNPSEDFFFKKKKTLECLKKKNRNKKLIVLSIAPLEGKEDVVGSKLLKVFIYIQKKFEENNFKIESCAWDWDKSDGALFWFLFDRKKKSEFIIHKGPPLKAKIHVIRFEKKHKKTFVKNKKIFAKIKRKFRTPEDCLFFLIKDMYIKERVKDIKVNL